MGKVLYMAVTNDKYEIPMCVEDSLERMAQRVGVNRSTICRHIHGKVKSEAKLKVKFIKVEVEE